MTSEDYGNNAAANAQAALDAHQVAARNEETGDKYVNVYHLVHDLLHLCDAEPRVDLDALLSDVRRDMRESGGTRS